MNLSLKRVVLIIVCSMYFLTLLIVAIFFTNFYKTNLQKKYNDENKNAVNVVRNIIEEANSGLYEKAKLISDEKEVVESVVLGQLILIEKAENGKYITKMKVMNKLEYLNMLRRINKKYLPTNGTTGVTPQYMISIFDSELRKIADTATVYSKYMEKDKEEYLGNIFSSKERPDLIYFISESEGKYFYKAVALVLDSVEGKLENIDVKTNKGLVVVSEEIDPTYLREMSKTVNREIFIIKNGILQISTLYNDREMVKNIQVYKEREETDYWRKIIRAEKSDYVVDAIPLRNYYGKIVGYIGVGYNYGELVDEYWQTIIRFMIISFISSIILLIILYVILKHVFNPFEVLINVVTAIKNGEYSKTIKIDGSREIKILGESINNLSAAVESREKELIEKNNRLMELDKLKDDFLANISHELRTPLNGIIGLSESLIDGVGGTLPEKAKYNLGMVISSGKRLLSLVNDILDFSKLKHMDLEISEKPIDIHLLADIVLMMNRQITDKKGIYLKNSIPEDFPYIVGDENRIEQILYNLIGNAIKFTDIGNIEVSAEVNGEYAVIAISDTGIGISEDKYEKIFESFEQVDGSIARNYGGTGLGLSISKQLVELHRGKIWVESIINKGSVFKFTIPISKEVKRAVMKIDSNKESLDVKTNSDKSMEESINQVYEEEKLKGEEKKLIEKFDDREEENRPEISEEEREESKILVVDDEVINLQVLIDHLQMNNMKVDVAKNGIEALNKMANMKYDLVLLDVMMPKMSGYEVCKHVRKKFSLVEMPVLMLTAKTGHKDIELGFDAGANDYLTKPFEKKELLSRVNTLVSLKNAVRISIINAEKYSTEKQHREMAEELREINNSLTSELKIEKVLEKLYRILAGIIEFESGEIFLIEEKSYQVYCYNGNEIKIKSDEVYRNSEMVSEIISTKTMMLKKVDDIEDGFIRKWILCIPVILREKAIGVLLFESSFENFLEEKEIDFIYTIIGQAAVALENAKLFEEVKKWTKELEKTNNMLENSIEELRTRQAQLVMSEKMAALGGLVAGVAHEINTPVGVCLTAVSYMKDKTKEFIKGYQEESVGTEEIEKYLETAKDTTDIILTNIERAGELIKSFKQVAVDQTNEEKRLFNVKGYIETILKSLYPKWKDKKHTIELICDEKIEIVSYPGALHQIISNLILNSLLHGFDGIEKGEIKLEVNEEMEYIVLKYEDNGVGMSKENIEKIYEPFFTTKRGQGGIGLGMNIVYSIISRKLNGSIVATSEIGKGVRFEIKIPISEA